MIEERNDNTGITAPENDKEIIPEQETISSETEQEPIKTIETGAPGELYIDPDERPENEIPIPKPEQSEYTIDEKAVAMQQALQQKAMMELVQEQEIVQDQEIVQEREIEPEPDTAAEQEFDAFKRNVGVFKTYIPNPEHTKPMDALTDNEIPAAPEPEPKNKKSFNVWVIVLMVGVVLVVVAVAVILLRNNKKTE